MFRATKGSGGGAGGLPACALRRIGKAAVGLTVAMIPIPGRGDPGI